MSLGILFLILTFIYLGCYLILEQRGSSSILPVYVKKKIDSKNNLKSSSNMKEKLSIIELKIPSKYTVAPLNISKKELSLNNIQPHTINTNDLYFDQVICI
jgi:hypothetical protein